MARNRFFCFFSFLVFAFFFDFSGCLQFAGIFAGLHCSSALRKNHEQINMIRNHFSLQSGARAPKPAQSIKKGVAAMTSEAAQKTIENSSRKFGKRRFYHYFRVRAHLEG